MTKLTWLRDLDVRYWKAQFSERSRPRVNKPYAPFPPLARTTRHIGFARPGADKNEPPNEIASLGYDFLSNHAADGPAKEVNRGKLESVNEGDGVAAIS